MKLYPLDAAPDSINSISELWIIACEKDLEISERLVHYHLSAVAYTEVGCRLAQGKGQIVPTQLDDDHSPLYS